MPLSPNHGWRAKPGCKVFAADRGAVCFQIPDGWLVEPQERSIRFHDLEPPNDNCRLELSVFHLPNIDWSGLPLAKQLAEAAADPDLEVIRQGSIRYLDVPERELEIAWLETIHRDRSENREAVSRLGLARGKRIQVLLTMDFWASDLGVFDPAWQTALETLELGLSIQDPTQGPRLQ